MGKKPYFKCAAALLAYLREEGVETCRVYYNLHRCVFSVADQRSRKVVAHSEVVALEGVRFSVSQAGRARVLAERRKNVHAFVIGKPALPALPRRGYPLLVRYNPYKAGHFWLSHSEEPIAKAERAVLSLHESRPIIQAVA